MKYVAIASNKRIGKEIELDVFNSAKEAWWNIMHNIEWGKNTIREEWTFRVVEISDDN